MGWHRERQTPGLLKAMIRSVLVFLIALVSSSPSLLGAEGDEAVATISPRVTAFLQKHCVGCHGPDEQNADIRLDTLSTEVRDETVALQWQDILDVLNLSQMPPEEAEQPAKAEMADVLETLTSDLRVARKRLTDAGGHIVLRRLNRREYQRTIGTLFGVPVDVSMLPEDATIDGFDTLGQAHSFSSLHLERYLQIAREVLDRKACGRWSESSNPKECPKRSKKKLHGWKQKYASTTSKSPRAGKGSSSGTKSVERKSNYPVNILSGRNRARAYSCRFAESILPPRYP